jgi:LacI family transcriptional regulator
VDIYDIDSGNVSTMATLKDVAREAGVGLGTVSRALSGHPQVSPETRQHVTEVALRLGYQSNGLARALRRNETNTIGLIIPDLENEFYTAGASILQKVLAVEGYQLVLGCSNDQPELDAQLLTSLSELRVDGIAHVPCTPTGSAAVQAQNPRRPVVEYARRSEATGVDSVVGSEHEGIVALVDHLAGLGHRRIAMIAGPPHLSTTIARTDGFATALRRNTLHENDCPIVHGSSYQALTGADITRQILAGHPHVTAILASSSRFALGVLESLNAAGLRIPEDMSVAGFLNPPWFAVADPPITTYELPLTEMGAMAAELLLQKIRDKSQSTSASKSIRIDGKLVIRESTGSPRVGDMTVSR